MSATLLLALKLLIVVPVASRPACDPPVRLLDGRTVTHCGGRVASVRDDLGNERLAGRDF